MAERWPELAGRIVDGVHILPVRVYYEDTDFSGFVYHANYLKFCERGRSDCLRLLGIQHHELAGQESAGRTAFVVRRMVCDFLKPARMDEVLEVESRFAGFSGARMDIDQKVIRAGDMLFKATVTAALVDSHGRPKRFPKPMLERLAGLTRD